MVIPVTLVIQSMLILFPYELRMGFSITYEEKKRKKLSSIPTFNDAEKKNIYLISFSHFCEFKATSLIHIFQ